MKRVANIVPSDIRPPEISSAEVSEQVLVLSPILYIKSDVAIIEDVELDGYVHETAITNK